MQLKLDQDGVSPAPAGMIPVLTRMYMLTLGEPRTRGDDPQDILQSHQT